MAPIAISSSQQELPEDGGLAVKRDNGPFKIPDELKARTSASTNYGFYMNEIFFAGMTRGIKPIVTTDPTKLEEQAKKALSAKAYNYAAGGAGERATMEANRLAFRTWKIIPRMLVQCSTRDLSTTILGQKYPTPIVISPVGLQKLFHPDGEPGTASIAAELGIPFSLSTAATTSIEDAAKANGNGKRWYQLYWPQDDEVTVSLLSRAKSNGYSTLVITLDTWALAWRPWDLDEGFIPFMKGLGDQIGFTDPVFRRKFEAKHGVKPEDNITMASMEWQKDTASGKAHSWEELAFIRKHWEGPIVLKGIQHPDDARRAVEYGMDGIVVSNHGGRQMDGAVGSLEMLPECVAAVGDKIDVLFDSGVRTGMDILKALCLGAKGVLVARPFLYGLAVGGKLGAKQVLQGLLADLDQSMGLAGVSKIDELKPELLRRTFYPGDAYSSL